MTLLAGPFSIAEADARSRAALRAIVRKRGGVWVDGKGAPPGAQVGPGPRNLPSQGWATHAVPSLAAQTPGQAYLRVTAEMAALDVGTEIVDGSDIPITREGAELDPAVLLVVEDSRTIDAERAR